MTPTAPRIGTVGADVPVELVLAAGAVPVRLGRSTATTDAHRERARSLLGAVDPAAVELLAGILAGGQPGAPGLAGIVCSRDREASLRVFYVLRELRASGATLPPVHLVDLVHQPRAESLRYDVSQLEKLATVLAGWTGTDPRDPARLLRAASEVAGVRDLLGQVQQQRACGTVRGSAALALFDAAATSPPQEARAVLRAALERAVARTPDVRPVLFLTGSAQDHPAVYLAIEERGWTVAGEDHDRGALALTVKLTADAVADEGLVAVARVYRDRGPDSATAAAAARAEYADERAHAVRALGVLGVVRVHDEGPLWDLPALRERLGRRKVPIAVLRDQGLDVDGADLDVALAELDASVRAEVAR